MEAEPSPMFLNNEFLTECLRKEIGNEKIVVESYVTSRAVPPGENFASCPYRIEINFKYHPDDNDLHFISLIVKVEPQEGNIKDVADEFELSEPLFYSKFMPEVNKLIKTQLAPKSFFSPRLSTVILEDLTKQGFIMANKAKMLDFKHCRLYFTAAAILHAVSFAIHKDNPKLVETIGKEKLFANDLYVLNFHKNVIRNGMSLLSESAKNIDGFKKYAKNIKDASFILLDLLMEAMKPSTVLNTLNQGDPWTTNMMFKYDEEGRVCDIRLLDFQLLRYSSPVIDLVFFIWTSATHEVRRHRLDELYHVYVETFNNKMGELNCKETVSFEHVKSEERKLSPLAIYLTAIMPPINSENSFTNLEPFFSKENEDEEAQSIYRSYYNENFCSYHVPRYLEQLELVGVFDYLLEQCNQLRS